MDLSSQKTCQYQFLRRKHNLETSFAIFMYLGAIFTLLGICDVIIWHKKKYNNYDITNGFSSQKTCQYQLRG